MEVGLDVNGKTIKAAMGSMDYHKCLACKKGWVSKKTADWRVKWADARLERYPEPSDWELVRFSDEMHSGYGPEHQLRYIRRPGERYYSDCIQRVKEPKDSDLKRQHTWSAAGFNFKGPIVFYTVPSNDNGKMTLQVYRDSILEPIVKPWIATGQNFVLEEDGDSGHGTGKKNIVRTWKQQHGLKYYFNCSNSPDLSPIENCWQASEQTLKKYPHWDDMTTRELIREGWDNLSQERINNWVHGMPQRLRDVLTAESQLTGY